MKLILSNIILFIFIFTFLESRATRSVKSNASRVSMQSRIDEQKKRAEKKKEEWDRSTSVSQADKPTVEDKVAA